MGQHLGCTEACNSPTASLTAWELCSNDVAAPPMGASLHHLSIHCIISPSALHHLTVVPCPFQQDRVGRFSCEDGVMGRGLLSNEQGCYLMARGFYLGPPHVYDAISKTSLSEQENK